MELKGFKFVKADFDALLGNFVDNLSVFLLLISLNLGLGMPAEIIFGRMVPGGALGLLAGGLYYSWLARRTAIKQGRDDVTALPCGIGVVYVLMYTTGILAPVAKLTGDPVMAWRICLAANVIGSLVCLAAAFFGPQLRRFLPSAAMLGTLGGLAVTSIAGLNLNKIFSNPFIGFPALAIIVWGYFAKGRMPFKLSPGLVSLILGGIIAVCMGKASVDITAVGIHVPFPWLFKVGGQAFAECVPYLSIIIPIAVVNFVVTLNQLEGARAAGDEYPVRNVLLADATASLIGALFGCPYPNSLYSGHPAYKRMGARQSYSAVNGILLFLLAFFGMFSFMSKIFPMAAITPILIYIGVINMDVAFTKVPKKHICASAIAFLPFISMVAKQQIDAAAGALGFTLNADTVSALSAGIDYKGFAALANGTILLAVILASIVAFLVNRELHKAAAMSAVATISSFFGLIHSSVLKPNSSPELTISWLVITAAIALGYFVSRGKTDAQALAGVQEE